MLFKKTKLRRAAMLINALIEDSGHATVRHSEKVWQHIPRLDGPAYDKAWDHIQSTLPKEITIIPFAHGHTRVFEFTVVGYDPVTTWYRFLEIYFAGVRETTDSNVTFEDIIKPVTAYKERFERAHGIAVHWSAPKDYVYHYHKRCQGFSFQEIWERGASEGDDLQSLSSTFILTNQGVSDIAIEDLPATLRNMLNKQIAISHAKSRAEGRYPMSIPTMFEFQKLVGIKDTTIMEATYRQSKIVYPDLPPIDVIKRAQE